MTTKLAKIAPTRRAADDKGAGGEGKAKPDPKAKAKAEGDGGAGDGAAGDDDKNKKKKPAAGAEGGDGSGDDSKKKKDVKAGAEGDGDGDGEEGDGDDSGGADGDGDGEGAGEGDWRARMAGGDEAVLARLKRFTSEADVGRSLLAAEKLARQKGGIQPPAADAPPEEKAKFYTQHFGRPENIEDFELRPSLPEGEELQEPEVQLLQTVTGQLHQLGIFGGDQLQSVGQLVVDMVVGGRAEMTKKVKDARAMSRKILEKAWGVGDVEPNLAYANNYAAYRCEQVGVNPKALAELKLEDGSLLGDNPLWAQVMAAGGRDHAEDPGMLHEKVEGGVGDLQTALKAEMAKMNSKDPKERKFYASDEGKALRNRLRGGIKRAGGGGKSAAKK